MPQSGKAIAHDAAPGHVTGRAPFIDDLPAQRGELFVDFIGAPCAAGELVNLDLTAARNIPGVVTLLTHRDIPGSNHWGPILTDEPILVEKQISYLQQPVAIVAASSREAALRAREAAVIEVKPTKPTLTIEEAIAADDYLGDPLTIQRGDVQTAIARSSHQLKGVMHIGGQEQFYLESQACIAYPDEAGRIKVISSTQNPTETQIVLAEVLGVAMNKVVCECRRMGGGFGGKETQSVLPACFAALVAHHTGRSARIIYTKDDDMKITGKRHAYRVQYHVGFDEQGLLRGLDAQYISDGGAFCDLSPSVLERTLLHADNAYFLPSARLVGRIARTNKPPNTAFRGFGGPQGIAAIESIIQDIARTVGRDACEVRRDNLYHQSPRDVTPYGQVVRDHVLQETLDRLRQTSDYDARRAEITALNKTSPTHLRGLALTCVKFGISFTNRFLNQGNALVNVYEDGSIQVSTGGTEMGQGLNTKIRQLVADVFDLAIDQVMMMTTSTEKNNNTSPTAASASTDLNGKAAVDAAERIKARLSDFAATKFVGSSSQDIRYENGQVFDHRHPTRRIAFAALCHDARRARVDLGAHGFYATPGVEFDRTTGQGTPFFYFTTGAAVAEVTIDRFTGCYTVDRVDMLMDIGESINPGVDRGQMIGGFVQGMGWCTTEELCYNDKADLLSHSPTTYKIPNVSDVPEDFRCDTIDNPRHKINVRRSKAVGEPPLMLGLCVWAAIKDALDAASEHPVNLPLPATPEQVLLCLDNQSDPPLDQPVCTVTESTS